MSVQSEPAGLGTSPSSEPNWLTAPEQDAWVGLLSILFKVPPAVDAQLQRDAGLNLFEYLVLSSLSHVENRTMRMSELAELINGSLSRLSNVVKRMESRGWIRREPDPDDGRYTHAVLTDAGWEHVVNTAPGHVEAVRHFVIDPLTPEQVRTLHEIGQTLRKRAQEGLGDPCTALGAEPATDDGDSCPPPC